MAEQTGTGLVYQQYKFHMDCFRFRQQEKGEEKWHEMMAKKQEISKASFVYSCDFNGLVEDGETVENYLSERKREDPETKFFQSTIRDVKVRFLQTCGFEFIFINQTNGKEI